jgi:hypothetical protein
MIPLVEFPQIVQIYAPFFETVFNPEAFIEFKRYISGLIVSENKTVEGINRLFVNESRNQSSLNRLLTQSPFSLEALNTARLRVLASLPGTQLKPKGVLSVDDTLLMHTGQEFEYIAKLYDPVSASYVQAHDLVGLHYSDDQTDYPLHFQLWKPVDLEQLEAGLRSARIPLLDKKLRLKETAPDKWRAYLLGVWQRRRKQHPELAALYQTKLDIAQALIQTWQPAHPQGNWPVTFDHWYTKPPFCQFLDQQLGLAYVGALTEKDRVLLQSGQQTLGQFAARLRQEQQAGQDIFRPLHIPFKGAQEDYYSYCNTHHLPGFGRQRLVINYREADLSDHPHFWISNRLVWQAQGITRIARHRWPIEVYHEEGKAEGLDQYQLRDFGAIQRHVALVAVVYSLLRAAQQDPGLRAQLQRKLQITLEGSPAAWRRASQAQCLWEIGLVISAGLAAGQSLPTILAPLIHALCG